MPTMVARLPARTLLLQLHLCCESSKDKGRQRTGSTATCSLSTHSRTTASNNLKWLVSSASRLASPLDTVCVAAVDEEAITTSGRPFLHIPFISKFGGKELKEVRKEIAELLEALEVYGWWRWLWRWQQP